MPDVNGLCNIHAAQQSSKREAKSIVGTVPKNTRRKKEFFIKK